MSYDGIRVNYYLDGIVKHQTNASIATSLYLDSSFYNVGDETTGINNVIFGPFVTGPSGANGAVGPTGPAGPSGPVVSTAETGFITNYIINTSSHDIIISPSGGSGGTFNTGIKIPIDGNNNSEAILVANKGTGGIQLQNSSSEIWTFANDGSTMLPNGTLFHDDGNSGQVAEATAGTSLNLVASQAGFAQIEWTDTPGLTDPNTSLVGSFLWVDATGAHIQVSTSSTQSVWNFDTAGSLTVSGAIVDYGRGNAILSPSVSSLQWIPDRSITNTDPTLATTTTAVMVTQTEVSILIKSDTTASSWAFNDTGVTFPDGSVQLTAATSGSNSPAGAGSPSYSSVWVLSTRGLTTSSWTSYTLTGQMPALFNGTTATVSTQVVYGHQFASGDKILVINNGTILSNSYGMVVEFPASPSVGDTFSVPTTGGSSISKLIFKPASGQRGITMNNGISGVVTFGQGTSYIAVYLDLTANFGTQPITWVYAGIINSYPTWYQLYF